MRPESESLLWDALDAGRKAVSFAEGRSFEDYLADEFCRAAVERKLYIVGEAIAQLRQSDSETFDLLSDAWKIVGFRHVLAHGYNRIDDARLWAVLKEALPATIREIEELLGG